MKAFDILVFMIAFNLSLNMVILIAGESAPTGMDMTWNTEIIAGVSLTGVAIITALGVAIAASSFTVIGTQVTKPVGVVAFGFSLLYIFTMVQAMGVLATFHIGETPLVPGVIIGILVIMNIGVFIGGLMQIATGGWRSAN